MPGDSYAVRFRARYGGDGHIDAAGRSGACVVDDEFRCWAIRRAALLRPRCVVILAGGNDLARPTFRLRQFFCNLRELSLGLLAAGAELVLFLPIPPRLGGRGVSPSRFQRRRWLANRLLQRKFRRPPVACLEFVPPVGFLGDDGVHPSALGWRALKVCIDASPH